MTATERRIGPGSTYAYTYWSDLTNGWPVRAVQMKPASIRLFFPGGNRADPWYVVPPEDKR